MHLIVFDVDGTLVDSKEFDDRLYELAVQTVLGIEIDNDFSRYQNVTDSGILDEIIDIAKIKTDRCLGACAIGCFCWAPRGFAGNETSDCLLQSATRGHKPEGGRRMPVDGPANRADWGRIALLHAADSPCIRLMFNARHTRAHSPRAWSRPRTLNWRKPSACLIQPLGASDSHLRLAYCT